MSKLNVAVIDTAIQILREGGISLEDRKFPYTCYALRVAQGLSVHESDDASWSTDLYIVPFIKFSAEKFEREVCEYEPWRFAFTYERCKTPSWWSNHNTPALEERISHLLEFRATLEKGELQ